MMKFLFLCSLIALCFATETKNHLRHKHKLPPASNLLASRLISTSQPRFKESAGITDSAEVNELKEELRMEKEKIKSLQSINTHQRASFSSGDPLSNPKVLEQQFNFDNYHPQIKMSRVEVPDVPYQPRQGEQPVQQQYAPNPQGDGYYLDSLPRQFDPNYKVPTYTASPYTHPMQNFQNLAPRANPMSFKETSFQEVPPPAEFSKPILQRYNEMASKDLDNFIEKSIDSDSGDINVRMNMRMPEPMGRRVAGIDY